MDEARTQAFWLIAVVEHARSRGLPLGVDPGLLRDPMGLVPLTAFYDALERAATQLDDPDLGLRLGRGTDEATLGAMAFVSATAATFGEGLAQFAVHMPAGESFEIVSEGEQASLRFHPWGPSRRAHALRAESFLADIVLNATQFADGAVGELEARLRTDDGARVAAVSEALQIPVRGGAPLDELRLDAAALALPSTDANPAMHAFFTEYLTARRPPEGEALAGRVRRLIDARLPDGPFEAASLAAALQISARTLQRRLGKEGTSLRALLTERRLLRAQRALDAGRSMSEAAFEAGYSEASALHRALRRRG